MEVRKTCTTCGATETHRWRLGPTCARCYERCPTRQKYRNERRRRYARTPLGQFKQHLNSCKKRNTTNALSFDEFHRKRGPCFYCSGDPPETGAGLDRIDNSKGYTFDNVIPCCTNCNYLRSDLLTVQETKAVVSLLMRLRRTRKKSPWKIDP